MNLWYYRNESEVIIMNDEQQLRTLIDSTKSQLDFTVRICGLHSPKSIRLSNYLQVLFNYQDELYHK
jgi:hypothetical protein